MYFGVYNLEVFLEITLLGLTEWRQWLELLKKLKMYVKFNNLTDFFMHCNMEFFNTLYMHQ